VHASWFDDPNGVWWHVHVWSFPLFAIWGCHGSEDVCVVVVVGCDAVWTSRQLPTFTSHLSSNAVRSALFPTILPVCIFFRR
jgi:hypothetical protein